MFATKFYEIVRALVEERVDFIVIGGFAAALQGAPLATYDVDIVHSTEPSNVARLLKALEALDAYYRLQPERRLRPAESHLSSAGHQLLMTRFGMLDCLGSAGAGRGYAELLRHSSELDVRGARIRVLDLETIIALKEELGGEKDSGALPTLRRTLEETRKRRGDLR